jgi:hypothetical protein
MHASQPLCNSTFTETTADFYATDARRLLGGALFDKALLIDMYALGGFMFAGITRPSRDGGAATDDGNSGDGGDDGVSPADEAATAEFYRLLLAAFPPPSKVGTPGNSVAATPKSMMQTNQRLMCDPSFASSVANFTEAANRDYTPQDEWSGN